MTSFNVKVYKKYLIEYIRENVLLAKAKGVIVGVSGGVDSAVVLSLAAESFPKNYLAFYMPLNNDELDEKCIGALKQKQFQIQKLKTKKIFREFVSAIGDNKKITDNKTIGNLKSRIRTASLFTKANIKNYLVLGTGNYSEYDLGYFTKFGDGSADLFPLVRLFKSEVYALAHDMDVPSMIIKREPTASLWKGQTDEKEFGFTYGELELFIKNDKKIITEKNKLMTQMNKNTEHKRKVIFPEWPDKV